MIVDCSPGWAIYFVVSGFAMGLLFVVPVAYSIARYIAAEAMETLLNRPVDVSNIGESDEVCCFCGIGLGLLAERATSRITGRTSCRLCASRHPMHGEGVKA